MKFNFRGGIFPSPEVIQTCLIPGCRFLGAVNKCMKVMDVLVFFQSLFLWIHFFLLLIYRLQLSSFYVQYNWL